MKIQNNKSYNVNFGCKRLFQATLKQPKLFGIEKNTDVFISELETSDLFRMDNLKHYWEKSHFGLNIIRNFVSMSKEYNYIDDEIFAENYINTYSHQKGKRKLKYELISKGVDKEIIDQKLEDLIDEDMQI